MKKVVCMAIVTMWLCLLIGSAAFAASVVQIAWNSTPKSGTNPFLVYNEEDYIFLNHIYEPLIIGMMDGSATPWLVKEWSYDAEKLAWTFKFDQRAVWSDGTPLTAQDAKFTFETLWKYDFAMGASTKEFVKSLETPDDYTLVITMTQPHADFLRVAGATLVMPKHIWSKIEQIDKSENPSPVGSGPFLFKEFQPNAFLQLVKNPNYWQGAPKFDELIIKIITNPSAAVMALKKGEIDIIPDMTGSENLVPALLTDPNVKVSIDKWFQTFYLAPNHRIAPLNNKALRHAISLAIDREQIVTAALNGYAELPQMGYVPPALTKWAHPNLVWEGMGLSEEERLAKANALLDEQGFAKGSDGIRQTKDGKRLAFVIRTLSSYPAYVRAAGLIKDSLNKIGIEISVTAMEVGALIPGMIFSGKNQLDWDFYLAGSNLPGIDRFQREYAPENPTRWECGPAFGWNNPDVVALLQQSRVEMNEEKRIEILRKAQEGFADDLAVIPLAHRYHVTAYRIDKFTGWQMEKIAYGNMFHPLASSLNLLALQPK